MSGIAIYVEGGGDTAESKAQLRSGLTEFLAPLRERARERKISFKIVMCGSRNDAFERFEHANRNYAGALNFLLVDSEAPVTASAWSHLSTQDGWGLTSAQDDRVHLMVQVMETWLAADPDALSKYYGDGFRRNALPSASDIEQVHKDDITRALKTATRGTKKGEYHKIRHASDLLKKIKSSVVRDRCRACERLLATLEKTI